ncbi:MAG: hypothetical protein J6V50_04340 [Clostridia bacterium]|nr:hypothetical protein [Clostridia bacterium]
MNYDNIILELLDRIKVLEEQVNVLMEKDREKPVPINKISTGNIRDYINECKIAARNNGNESLVLVAGDIHREMKLKSAMPMVCNAMRQCMDIEDIVLYETASGYSSTLKIEYKL